jgi:hypothetical protein
MDFLDRFVLEHRCSRYAALKLMLTISIKSRGEDPTEAAIAAEALSFDKRATVAQGVLYSSVEYAARAHSVNPYSVHSRMRAGETAEQAIVALLRTRPSFVVHGVRYPSLGAAARAHGVGRQSVAYRMVRTGEAAEEAINVLVERARRLTIVVHGKHYATVESAAKAYGITYASVLGRMQRKQRTRETVAEAIDAILLKRAQAVVSVHGKCYASIRKAAEAHGVNPIGVRCRMLRGETLEEAIDARIARSQGFIVRGEHYVGITTAARAHGVQGTSVFERMRRKGEPPDQAIDALIEFARKRVIVRGERYPSVSAAARAHGVSSGGVSGRMLRKGETPEQAIDAILASPNRRKRASAQTATPSKPRGKAK